MPLFQSTVLKKYTNALDTATVDAAYERFSAHFHNAVIQENIRLAKEEQYQGEFLIDLFVKVLGYVKNPTPDFNLTTEFKNIKDSKKADGAILTPAGSQGEGVSQVIAVIELKGTAVTDLGRIEVQAFGYKNNQPGCVYVITSNFEKLRFYIDNAVDFEEFNLFQLSRERFDVLWLCLSAEQLLAGKPKQLKEESLSQEEQITKQLYKDYSLFRNEVFQNIVTGNPQYDKLTLFKQTQKLLDRFLFIFFAEDRLLLPPNSILAIVEQWKDLRDKYDAYTPLYDRFKKYFGYLNTGHKGQKHDIFAYNGGLFKPDPILDNLSIDDELLYKHVVKLSTYDFESEVSVNILGHIFEHSLNEIEEIQAELEGQAVDKSSSKRKKDGVFYTPKYITKYIVDNTVGKLCEEQKAALGIEEAEYDKGRKNRPVKVVKALKQKLDDYRAWLLQLTICDPACGSGAFLNQALEFLIAEHAYVDELQAKLFGDAMVLSDVENSILEHNLYGVDINNESVEIAKLSLWLRTAQKGRKLTSLNNNIKCGNSLIDDPAVAGDKAFDWEKEFPQVFGKVAASDEASANRALPDGAKAKSGFDVVIGNPPYVRQELFKEIKPYLQEHYKCYNSIADLYTYFIEKGIKLMNENGLFSFILPNKFIKATYGKEIRKVMKEDATLQLLYDFDDYPVFADATTYPIIFILSKNNSSNDDTFTYSEINKREDTVDPIFTLNQKKYKVNHSSITIDKWSFLSNDFKKVQNKIQEQSIELKNIVDNKIFRGVSTGCNEVFIVDENTKNTIESSNILKKILTGKEVKRYKAEFQNLYLIFADWDYDINSNIALKEYFEKNKEKLSNRPEVKEGRFNWWCLSRYGSKNSHLLSEPKIIYPRINNQCNFYLDESGEYSISDNNFFISSGDKSLLAFLNSSLTFFFLKNNCTSLQGGYWDFRRPSIEIIPIHKELHKIKDNLEVLATEQLENNKRETGITNAFLELLKYKVGIDKLTKNLQSWHTLDFKGFLKELKKAKVSLTLAEEAEWMAYFNAEKEKAVALQNDIDRLDKEIDRMVYGLYGLTEEEIAIVESA